jgi:hypothetical protein
MGLVELIDLILGLFFANDRLPLIVSKALQNTLMVQFHLLLLLLLLLKLKSHELILLLSNGCIFDALTLHGFILVFQVFDNFFKLLDSLRVDLVFLFLGLVLGMELSIKSVLKLLVC